MSQIPTRLIYLVVITIGVLAIMGLGSLCAALFWHVYADPAIMTAIITLTSGLTGSLVTILSNPRTHPPGDSTTTTTTTATSAPPTPSEPIPVTIENPASDPANVTEVQKQTER